MNNQQQQPTRQPPQTQMFGQNQNAVPQSPLLEPISRSVAPTISYTNSALAIAAAAAAAAAAANNANNMATNSSNNLAHQIQQQQPPLMSTSTSSNNAVQQPTMVNQQQQPAMANQSIITQQQQQAVAAIQPQQQPQPKMRKEIYRYTCDEALFAAAWSNKVYEDKRFRLLAGTILDEDNITNNKIFMVELDEDVGELVRKATFAHGYPISATKFIPNQDPSQPELFATTSNHLRIFRYHPGKDSITLECELNSMKSNMYAAPLTNLDWNEVDPTLVATCSIDTTCCVWNVETSQIVGQALTVKGTQKTQLIAHEKPVHDIAFARFDNGGRDQFATAGADGSVRLFDLRSLQHSTILYEDMEKRMLNHIAWNKRDPYKIATVAHESYEVVILDVRVPCRPMAKFGNHRGYVNGIAWAPHSTVHICTAGSDRQALIWQMNHFNRDEPILAYTAEGEINQIHWSSNFHQWICICFNNSMEILRV